MGHVTKCAWGAVAPKPDACLGVDVQEYATAQAMMKDPCLKLGYAHTLGFYEVGDGGEAYYTVVAAPTGDAPNGMDVLQCRRYVAELIIEQTVRPEQFGAHGDGNSDDTNVFNRVFSIVGKYTADGIISLRSKIKVASANKKYLVNNVTLPRELYCDFNQSIFSTTSTAFTGPLYQGEIVGGIYEGDKAFNIDNNNSDQGCITFDKCSFMTVNSLSIKAQSSKIVIKDCLFVENDLAIEVSSDFCIIENNWIGGINPSNGYNININSGKTSFIRNTLIPYATVNKPNTCWIKNTARVMIIEDNRFSGETGARCPIYHYSQYTNSCQTSLVFNNNHASNNNKDGLIKLFAFPNTLIVKGNYLLELNNYVITAGDTFENNLAPITSLWKSHNQVFYQEQLRLFYYDINNALAIKQNILGDFQLFENGNEWKFLYDNYKCKDFGVKQSYVDGEKATMYAQSISPVLSSNTSKTYVIPMLIDNGAIIEVGYNHNTAGAGYSINRVFLMLKTTIYNNAVINGYTVIELTKDSYTDSGSAVVGATIDGSTINNSGGQGPIAVQINGVNVALRYINVSPLK